MKTHLILLMLLSNLILFGQNPLAIKCNPITPIDVTNISANDTAHVKFSSKDFNVFKSTIIDDESEDYPSLKFIVLKKDSVPKYFKIEQSYLELFNWGYPDEQYNISKVDTLNVNENTVLRILLSGSQPKGHRRGGSSVEHKYIMLLNLNRELVLLEGSTYYMDYESGTLFQDSLGHWDSEGPQGQFECSQSFSFNSDTLIISKYKEEYEGDFEYFEANFRYSNYEGKYLLKDNHWEKIDRPSITFIPYDSLLKWGVDTLITTFVPTEYDSSKIIHLYDYKGIKEIFDEYSNGYTSKYVNSVHEEGWFSDGPDTHYKKKYKLDNYNKIMECVEQNGIDDYKTVSEYEYYLNGLLKAVSYTHVALGDDDESGLGASYYHYVLYDSISLAPVSKIATTKLKSELSFKELQDSLWKTKKEFSMEQYFSNLYKSDTVNEITVNGVLLHEFLLNRGISPSSYYVIECAPLRYRRAYISQ